MKNTLNKIFSSKKTNIPFFAIICLLQVLIVILSMLGGEQHWAIFANGLVILGLVIAIFVTNHFEKYTATRVLSTITFFLETMVISAYSFMAYPKAPSSSFVPFVFYIIFACTFFASVLCAIILHVNYSKKLNDNVLLGAYIVTIVMVVVALVQIIGTIIGLARGGYSHMGLCDLWCYISFCLISMSVCSNETRMLPTIEKSAK